MNMKERWKRYAKTIECDYCSDAFLAFDFPREPEDADEELAWVVEAAWIDHGFTQDDAPEPARDYLPMTCDACMHFLWD